VINDNDDVDRDPLNKYVTNTRSLCVPPVSPKTEPWGTPVVKVNELDETEPTRTD